MYRADGDEERINNVKELQNSIIARENEDGEKLTLEDYLQEVALYTDMDADDSHNDRVKLMTIHTAKGLEFPYVFLCCFTEGILPNHRSIKQSRSLEEERRLTYVAITRAKKAFYMTESEGFNYQTGMSKVPSRFLFEIKDNLYVRQGVLPKYLIDEAKRQIEMTDYATVPYHSFEAGDTVTHQVFGKGIVTEVDDYNRIYMIRFEKTDSVKPIRFEWPGLV